MACWWKDKHDVRARRQSRGVALILVLWVIALLSVIVAEFDFAARTELELTTNLKEDVEAYALAQAAFNLAVAEVLNNYGPAYAAANGEIVYVSALSDVAGSRLWDDAAGQGAEERAIVTARRSIPLGTGTCSYALCDEEGRMNLNALNDGSRTVFANLLYHAAGVQMGQERDIIFDSILDWKDEDQLYRLNGAEDDYYTALPRSYPCKDNLFDSVEELLLVRGVTKEIFFGTTDANGNKLPGIGKCLTVHSRRGGREFHPATASETLLQAYGFYLGMGSEGPSLTAALVAVPAVVRIVAQGMPATAKVPRTIEAVVIIQPPSPTYKVVYWNDNSLAELEPFEEEA